MPAGTHKLAGTSAHRYILEGNEVSLFEWEINHGELPQFPGQWRREINEAVIICLFKFLYVLMGVCGLWVRALKLHVGKHHWINMMAPNRDAILHPATSATCHINYETRRTFFKEGGISQEMGAKLASRAG